MYTTHLEAIQAAIAEIEDSCRAFAGSQDDYVYGREAGHEAALKILREKLAQVAPAAVEKPAPFVEKGLEPPLSPFDGTDCPKCDGEFCGKINADGSWSDGTKLICACGFRGWVNVHPEEGAYAGWDDEEEKPAPDGAEGQDFGAACAKLEAAEAGALLPCDRCGCDQIQWEGGAYEPGSSLRMARRYCRNCEWAGPRGFGDDDHEAVTAASKKWNTRAPRASLADDPAAVERATHRLYCMGLFGSYAQSLAEAALRAAEGKAP